MGDESRGRAHGLVGVCVALALCLGAAGTLGWFASVAPASPVAEPAPETGAAGALSRAREQLAAGEPAVAISTLEGLGAVELVEDYRLLLLARAQAAAGDPEAVVATSDAFVREHAHSPLRGAMGRVRGDAQAELGVEARARTAWADAARRTRDEDERAELLALQARSYERERARPDAAAVWLEIWTKLPHTPSGDLSEAALDRLEPTPGALRTAAARAERAQVLYDERHNEAALYEVERLLAGPTGEASRPPDDERLDRMRELRAYLLFRQRRYPDAVEAFEALGNDSEARFWRARSLARSGRIDASIAAFLAVAKSEPGALGFRSRFLAATLHEGEGRKADAARLYTEVATRAPRASQRRTARWRVGWMAYREGEFARSAELLGELARQHDDPLDALRPRYWNARALTRSDPPQGGQEELRALVGEMPFTYYGLRAGQRVGPAAPRAGSGPMPLPRLRADRLRRLRLMLLAGALEEVRIELPGLVRKARGVGDRGALAELLAAAGAYHEAERLIVDTERAELARGLDPARRTLWVHAWPRAFSTEVEAAARAAGIPEALLLSVMREESGFRPKVLSSVGARGLVQIMPTTGTHLARLLSWPQFDPDQLFDPETNLTLGARYLRNLLEEFDGRAAAAVAAYNAGENAVARWIDRNGGLEEDEWVEAIPYDQTRSYVRRVLRSLHVYRTLYPEAASVGAGADDTMSTTGTRKGGDAGTVALEVR